MDFYRGRRQLCCCSTETEHRSDTVPRVVGTYRALNDKFVRFKQSSYFVLGPANDDA